MATAPVWLWRVDGNQPDRWDMIGVAITLTGMAIIRHFKGNVRRITPLWDCDSEHTLRAVIRRLGLWEELERARADR